MLKTFQFGQQMFTSSPVVYITVDFKKSVSDLTHAGSFSFGRKPFYQEKKGGYQNSAET